MKRFFSFFHFLYLVFVCGTVFGQTSISSVEFDQIKQKKVKKIIVEQQNQEIHFFSELQVSVQSDDDISEFTAYEKIYFIKEDIDEVWNIYNNTSQTDVWDINRISVGMLVSKKDQSIVYANQDLYGLEVGQLYYLNLKVLNGIYNIPVVFEIIKVDPANRLFELSYLKGGKAQGKQVIQLVDTENGYTKIVHKSYVRSNSKIRDKYLYPFFHNKIINEFHANMKKMILENSKYRKTLLADIK